MITAVSTTATAICTPSSGLTGAVCTILKNLLTSLLGIPIGVGVSNLIVYSAEADCPAGDVAIGGGGATGTLAGVLATSAPTNGAGSLVTNGQVPRGWLVIDTGVSTLQAYAICTPGS